MKRGVGMRDYRAILIEDEPSHAEQKVREHATQRLLGHVSEQPRADEDAHNRDERECRHNVPWHRHLTPITERPRGSAQHDHEQRRSDGRLHRQTRQKHERRNEQETAARPDEARQDADAEADAGRRRDGRDDARAFRERPCRDISPAQHQRRRDQHYDAEEGQLHDAGYQLRYFRTQASMARS